MGGISRGVGWHGAGRALVYLDSGSFLEFQMQVNVNGPEALRIAMAYLSLTSPQKRLVDLVVDSYSPVHKTVLARSVGVDESALRGLLIAIGRNRTKFGCRHEFLTHDVNDKDCYFVPVWVKDAIRAARQLHAATCEIAGRKHGGVASSAVTG